MDGGYAFFLSCLFSVCEMFSLQPYLLFVVIRLNKSVIYANYNYLPNILNSP